MREYWISHKWNIRMAYCEYRFLVMSEVTRQRFSRVTQSRVKIIGKSLHEWTQKSLLKVRHTLSLHAISCSESNHWIRISSLAPRTLFYNTALWRHHSWLCRKREALVLWRQIHRMFLYAQIQNCNEAVINPVHGGKWRNTNLGFHQHICLGSLTEICVDIFIILPE